MDETFSISTGVREGFQIIVVRGELDELTAPELEHAFEECCERWPMIVDLSNIAFISSAGIHALLRERPGRIALVCPRGNVLRLFEIVRANRRVPIFEDIDSALASQMVSCSA